MSVKTLKKFKLLCILRITVPIQIKFSVKAEKDCDLITFEFFEKGLAALAAANFQLSSWVVLNK